MFLLDTNVVSDSAKATPNAGVVAWFAQTDASTAFISVLTIGELTTGLERLPHSARRDRLSAWMEAAVQQGFRGRILPVTQAIAAAWGRIDAAAPKSIPPIDGLLAATARVHDLVMVTRNVRHFEAAGVRVHNPWT